MNNKKPNREILSFLAGDLTDKGSGNYIASLQKLKRSWRTVSFEERQVESNNDPTHIDDQTLAGFVQGCLDSVEEMSVKRHLRACTPCLERMAQIQDSMAELEKMQFEATPTELMDQAKHLQPTPANLMAAAKRLEVPESSSVFAVLKQIPQRIKNWFDISLDWRLGAAVGLAAATVLFIIFKVTSPAVKNISLGDRLVITDMGALGFATQQEVIDYPGMSVALSEDENSLVFTWPAVRDAVFYEIHLVPAGGTEKRLTPFAGVRGTRFLLAKREVEADTQYTWKLSGKLKDGRAFLAQAQFVLK